MVTDLENKFLKIILAEKLYYFGKLEQLTAKGHHCYENMLRVESQARSVKDPYLHGGNMKATAMNILDQDF